MTSVPVSIARPLIEGQRNETIVRDDTAAQLFPDVHPVGFDEAVTRTRSEAGTASSSSAPPSSVLDTA